MDKNHMAMSWYWSLRHALARRVYLNKRLLPGARQMNVRVYVCVSSCQADSGLHKSRNSVIVWQRSTHYMKVQNVKIKFTLQ